jgi:hypothetical protein
MAINQEACELAASVIRDAINFDRAFPVNVFAGDWHNFLFFDSDRMFSSDFVEHAQALLAVEGGTCACLLNIDSALSASTMKRFFVDAQTTADQYRSRLNGESVADGWIFDFDRFGCAPDEGSWCIYCERTSEIAAVGFTRTAPVERYEAVMSQLQAVPAHKVVEELLPSFPPPSAPAMAWRKELVREYAIR